jgi:hypothetical protein
VTSITSESATVGPPPSAVLERRVALLCALLRTVLCAYRAATQGVVHDEAYSYNTFLNGPWSVPYVTYNAGNHILFSFFSKASMALFGLSELTLRLPSVIAGFFLMWGIYRLLERTNFRALRWSMFLAIGLHPLLLDFSVAARGYGLALALLIWAMEYALRERRHVAGALLGLAISANFTMAFPFLALLGSLALTDEGPWRDRLRRLRPLLFWPVMVVGALCGRAMAHAVRENFYAGLPTIHDSLQNLVSSSLCKRWPVGLGAPAAVAFIQSVGVPAVGILAIARCVWLWRNRSGDRRNLTPALTLAISAAGLVSAHLLLRVPYPIDRTGLYIPVLAGVGWALITGELQDRRWRTANVALVCVLALQFATQFDTKVMYVWAYDWMVRDAAERIREESKERPPQSVSVAATWSHQPALEFYRQRYHITALQPVERLARAPLTGYNYYVLSSPDKDDPTVHFKVLLSDPFWGMILAVEGQPASASFFDETAFDETAFDETAFDKFSRAHPVVLSFSPGVVHPGESYTMTVPQPAGEWAGQWVDLLIVRDNGPPLAALHFRQLDQQGQVRVLLEHGFQPCEVHVRGVRRSGEARWKFATGSVIVRAKGQ